MCHRRETASAGVVVRPQTLAPRGPPAVPPCPCKPRLSALNGSIGPAPLRALPPLSGEDSSVERRALLGPPSQIGCCPLAYARKRAWRLFESTYHRGREGSV